LDRFLARHALRGAAGSSVPSPGTQ
jgi:hypothetical protein